MLELNLADVQLHLLYRQCKQVMEMQSTLTLDAFLLDIIIVNCEIINLKLIYKACKPSEYV